MIYGKELPTTFHAVKCDQITIFRSHQNFDNETIPLTAWIGLHDISVNTTLGLKWTDGTDVSFIGEDYVFNREDQNCGAVVYRDGYIRHDWVDRRCHNEFWFVCKFPSGKTLNIIYCIF